MVNALRLQGFAFCALALVISFGAVFAAPLSQSAELVIVAALIAALGVPHGALDTIFAKQLYDVSTPLRWVGFLALYILLAALVVGLWFLTPLLFLSGFLLISICHFSGDPAAETPIINRMFYGGAIIILPNMLHATEVTRIFAFLVDQNSAKSMVALLQILALPWAVAIAIAALAQARKNPLTSLELASLAVIATVASPLVAFTVFFCFMHSARHIMRTIDYAEKSSLYFLAASAVGPVLAISVLSLAAWNMLQAMPIDARIIQIIFVGLAALTVPHMALVEQVRLSGWATSRPPKLKPLPALNHRS